DLVPGRDRVDAQLVDLGAQLVGGGEGRGDVLTPGGQVAQEGDRLTRLHGAELELGPEQRGQLRRVQDLRPHRTPDVGEDIGYSGSPLPPVGDNSRRRSTAWIARRCASVGEASGAGGSPVPNPSMATAALSAGSQWPCS